MSKNQAKSSTVLSFASITFSPHLPCMSIVKCQCVLLICFVAFYM